MAKDPAFLFYPGDWLGGTLGMTLEEKGAYIELLMVQFNHGPFDEKIAKIVLREKPDLWESVKHKFTKDDSGRYFNQRLKVEKERRQNYTESRRQSRSKGDEDDVRIYIVRDNVRGTYKIGSSVNPVRRYNELANQKNPAIMADEQGSRDISLIWYSEAVLRKAESDLHTHFSGKNINGEWFSLSEADLKYIYSKYKGTFYRTSPRTENENRNENESEILNEYENWTTQILDNNEQYFQTMLMNEGPKLTPETFTLLVRSHLALLNRYPKMRPPNQQAFRRSLIGFLIENKDKKINGNGQDLNKNQQHLHNLATDYYNTYGPNAKGGKV